MGKTLEPQMDVYVPPKEHPWADHFRDVPTKWSRVPSPHGADGFVLTAGTGVLTHPTVPSQLARHAELAGFVLDPSRARIRRIDPVRGGRSLTSPGIWQDVQTPVPEGDPVHTVLATAAGEGLTPAEMIRAADELRAQAEASV